GIEVERKSRLVHIYRFRFTEYEEPVAAFRVACTKGTYVRSIAHDLGQKIGCGAHLKTLRRLISGRFDVQNAIQFEELCKLDPEQLPARVVPMLQLVTGG
ncbi:MAG: tRNA pseudouridine(55) synthase, partial [Verrucomicrobiales bacterium]